MTDSLLTLVRGHPGSGKSTYARTLLEKAPEGTAHLENDQFFIGLDGVYAFDPSQHEAAKAWCLSATTRALHSGRSVIVSNTFTTRAELAPYLDLGYPVKVVEMGLDFASEHNVPVAVIEAKKKQFEPHEGATVINDPTYFLEQMPDGLRRRRRRQP